jgi:lysophospholipase L1-like esterase
MRRRWHRKTDLLIILCMGCFLNIGAQEGDYYLGPVRYSFINYDQDTIRLPEKDSLYERLFSRIDSLVMHGTGKINIVHMGGSHIQADMYTQVIRQRFQQLAPDMNGGRGLIFPYKTAGTNNPSNYRIRSTGDWTSCRSTHPGDTCTLGLMGIAVTTTDSIASLDILVGGDPYCTSPVTRVRVFHPSTSYSLSLITKYDTLYGVYDPYPGFTLFESGRTIDEFELRIERRSETGNFTLMGISVESDAPGIVYNAVGVNGARLASYLGCKLYARQLAAINPDLIIFSIGTNDGYTRHFNKEKYYAEYCQLLDKTRAAVPGAAIMLTVPNDSYLYKRYVNSNTAEMRKIIYRLAGEYGCAVWDFYSIMGGLNSAQAWYSLKLMQYDRIHFTRQGYALKGELFFSAFLKAWEKSWYHDSKLITLLN